MNRKTKKIVGILLCLPLAVIILAAFIAIIIYAPIQFTLMMCAVFSLLAAGFGVLLLDSGGEG